MSPEIADYAARLLSFSGIKKVVSIDDDNSVNSPPEELLAVLNVQDQGTLTNVVGPLLSVESGDRDLIRDRVRTGWAELSEAVRNELLAKLTPPEQKGVESVVLEDDLRTTSKLPEIFGDKLQSLTLAEFEKRRQEFVNEQMPPTLLLVDLSFAGEQRGAAEGLQVIANLLTVHTESQIYCALLTGLCKTVSVHSDWKKIASEHGISPERFVLIPKDSLKGDQLTFLALIKLVVMNGPANALRRAVRKAYEDCLKDVDVELDKLDVFEFERIICLSSSIEGVWEPDTLVRIFSLFHKKFVRGSLRNNGDVHDSADYLRKLTSIHVGEWGGPTEMEIALRKLEWFEEAVDINDQHLPLELGDVFRIESRPNKLFVLVGQPCDLMMRQIGERHHAVENALLLEATPIGEEPQNKTKYDGNEKEEQGFFFKLDFFENARDWRVNLRKTHYVNLDVLDLCVFRSDGCASFSGADLAPEHMSQAWRARFPKLAAKMRSATVRYAELVQKSGMKPADASKVAMSISLGNLVKTEVVPKTGSITHDISRVGRLKQPRSGALLARYANALARDAFEHDLTRRPEPVFVYSYKEENLGDRNTSDQIVPKAEASDPVARPAATNITSPLLSSDPTAGEAPAD